MSWRDRDLRMSEANGGQEIDSTEPSNSRTSALTWVGPRGTLSFPVQEIGVPVKITLNGDPHEVAGPLTVSALLSQLEIDSRRVAVEHNLTVLKRALYESTLINEGDQIEIVNFVGGGEIAQAQRKERRGLCSLGDLCGKEDV